MERDENMNCSTTSQPIDYNNNSAQHFEVIHELIPKREVIEGNEDNNPYEMGFDLNNIHMIVNNTGIMISNVCSLRETTKEIINKTVSTQTHVECKTQELVSVCKENKKLKVQLKFKSNECVELKEQLEEKDYNTTVNLNRSCNSFNSYNEQLKCVYSDCFKDAHIYTKSLNPNYISNEHMIRNVMEKLESKDTAQALEFYFKKCCEEYRNECFTQFSKMCAQRWKVL